MFHRPLQTGHAVRTIHPAEKCILTVSDLVGQTRFLQTKENSLIKQSFKSINYLKTMEAL